MFFTMKAETYVVMGALASAKCGALANDDPIK